MVKLSLMSERVLSKVDMQLVVGSYLLSMMDMLLVLQMGSYVPASSRCFEGGGVFRWDSHFHLLGFILK